MMSGIEIPTLVHFQDPFPYRPEAWDHQTVSLIRGRLILAFKRYKFSQSLNRAKAIGWTSNYLKEVVCRKHNISPHVGDIYYNGIPEAWAHRELASNPEWSSRPLEILTVSNVDRYKGQHIVINSLPTIVKNVQLQNVVYRIIGKCTDNYREELMTMAEKLGVARHVRIEGRVASNRLHEALCSARCFVLMSLCESFGIPVIEAMSYGVPVIVSNCCALPEVAGESSLLCAENDSRQLAVQVVSILTDGNLSARLAQSGIKNVTRFLWKDTAERMANTLERISCS